MGDYADFSDIQSEFSNLILSAATGVSEDEVTEFISQEEAVINAIISNRYEIPITGSAAVKILKDITITYVAYRVATIINLKKNVPIPEKFVAQILNIGSRFLLIKKQLLAIQSGKIVLKDAQALSSEQGIKSFNAENNILPIWERDTKQW